jgi:hypothetical protein
MQNLMINATTNLPQAGISTCEARVSDHIFSVLTDLLPHGRMDEQRRNMRYPYPYLISLTPVAEDDTSPLADPITVIGKSISACGIAFYHRDPLPFRRVVLTLGDAPEHGLSVIAELLWCRFVRQGWYDSGGRLVALCDGTQGSHPCSASRTA